MAIEKMKMLNIVLPKHDVYPVMRDILTHERVEMINAHKAIDETSFLLSATVDNAEVIQELNDVGPFQMPSQATELDAKLQRILQGTTWKPSIDYTTFDKPINVSKLEDKLALLNQRLEEISKERVALKPYGMLADLGLDLPLDRMAGMDYLTYKIGFIHPASYQRLKLNAENISSMFLHLGTYRRQELCLFVYPKNMEIETKRILLSVQFDEIEFDPMFYAIDAGTAPNRLKALKVEAEEIAKDKMILIENYAYELDVLFTRVQLDRTLEEIEEDIGASEHFAYISIWVPAKRVQAITDRIQQITKGIVEVYGSQEARSIEQAPTSLKNVKFFRPFEALVLMYDVPNYHELDPTPFFAIAYMLLFGSMFGDLGQGFVILLAGLFMMYHLKNPFGNLLVRLGGSSMVFGFVYDSLFGFEHVISRLIPLPIYFYPFENTNLVLVAAIMVGLFLIVVSYIYGIINKYRLGEREEMVMGKTGIAGLVFFLAFVLSILPMVTDISVPYIFTWPLVIVSVLVIILKEPITNIINKEDHLFESGLGEFLTEQFFELLETFLSMFSNGLSFIRVGAFALSHVGLFVAFHTLAQMIGGAPGVVSMAFVGNILIIVLEGLVVFIQGLRLMYYELFSKYFIGEGRQFDALKLEEK